VGKSPIHKISISPGDWAGFREQMPVTRRWAYFDHAAVAPLPAPTAETVERWCRRIVEHGDVFWPRWAEGVEQTRGLAADLIGAETGEIALIHNTTTGIGLVAEGMDWRDGDNVVLPVNEFPSNAYPWLHLATRGVEPRQVEVSDGELDPQKLLDACDERTRILALSWVGFSSGWRADIETIVAEAHRRGILVFLDAIQGLGVFPVDVGQVPIDFLAADGHKWLLGPEGAGFLYVRRERLDELRPLGVGWNSVVNAHDFDRICLDLKPTAARYEGGTQNMVGVLALGASLQLLMQLGSGPRESAVGERVLQLTEMAAERLQATGAEIVTDRRIEARRSGILAFRLPGVAASEVRQACLQAEIVVSCRGGGIRISPHAYNNLEDIERLTQVVERLIPKR